MNTEAQKVARRKKLRLGEVLIEAGAITQEQLETALAEQKRTGYKLGRALTDVGAISERELHEFLAKKMELDYIDLRNVDLDHSVVSRLAEVQARRFGKPSCKRRPDLLQSLPGRRRRTPDDSGSDGS